MISEKEISDKIQSFFYNNEISNFKNLINILLDFIDKKPNNVDNYIYLSMCYFIIDENNLSIKWLNVAKKFDSENKFLIDWNIILSDNINKTYSNSNYILDNKNINFKETKKVIVSKVRRLK